MQSSPTKKITVKQDGTPSDKFDISDNNISSHDSYSSNEEKVENRKVNKLERKTIKKDLLNESSDDNHQTKGLKQNQTFEPT